jgi:hypothetical protein
MQAAQGSRSEPLRPVEAFLDAHVDKPDGVVKTAARRGCRTPSRRWVSTRRIKTGGLLASQGAAQKEAAIRPALPGSHLAKIARVAAVDLPNIWELDPLRMPRKTRSASNLAASAADLARTAEPYADVFTAAGLPTDLIAQLIAPTDATRNAISEAASSRGRRSGATGASSRGYRPAARSCTSSTRSCGACSGTISHCSGTGTSSSAYRDPRAVRHRPHRSRRRHRAKRHPRPCRCACPRQVRHTGPAPASSAQRHLSYPAIRRDSWHVRTRPRGAGLAALLAGRPALNGQVCCGDQSLLARDAAADLERRLNLSGPRLASRQSRSLVLMEGR